MSAVGGSNIVTNGLVLCLDAANPKSYTGSGTAWTDLSGNSRNGTLTNGPIYNSANGGYFNFAGAFTDQSVQCSGSVTLTAATFVTWIRRFGDQNPFSGLVFSRGSVPTGLGFRDANRISYTWNDAANTYTWVSGLTIPDSAWCMVAVCVTSNSATAYLCQPSGITSAVNTVSHASTTLDDIKIATDDQGGRNFKGQLSVAMIYDRALSAAEIQQNYNALRARYPQPVVDSSLKLWIDADNSNSYPGSGTAVTDLSGNGRTQNLSNSLAYTVLFDGIKCWNFSTTYYMEAATIGPTLPTTGFTYTVWARMKSSTAGWRTLLHSSPDDATIVIENGSNRLGIFDDTGSIFISAGYDVAALANTWVQWSVTGNASGQVFYINGVQVGATTTTSAGNAHWRIGGWSDGLQGFGHVAQVQLYDRTLGPQELLQNYDATRERFEKNTFSTVSNINRAVPGLVCALDPANSNSWPGSGSNLIDLTGNGYNLPATSSDFATYDLSTVLRLDGGVAIRAITGLNITLPYTILGVSRYNGLGVNSRNRTIASNSNNWLMNHWSNAKSRYYAEGWITAANTNNNADNNWQIGIVTGATGDFHCFFDGTTDSAVAPAAGTAAPGPITLGGKSAGTASESSNCDIGLFLVWNRVLTQQEINTVYNLVRRRFGQY